MRPDKSRRKRPPPSDELKLGPFSADEHSRLGPVLKGGPVKRGKTKAFQKREMHLSKAGLLSRDWGPVHKVRIL